jgi:hypothetical protein
VDIVVQPEGALREALSLAASFHRALRECGDRVVQVSTAADLDAVEAGERIGLLLSRASSASASRHGPPTCSTPSACAWRD